LEPTTNSLAKQLEKRDSAASASQYIEEKDLPEEVDSEEERAKEYAAENEELMSLLAGLNE